MKDIEIFLGQQFLFDDKKFAMLCVVGRVDKSIWHRLESQLVKVIFEAIGKYEFTGPRRVFD